MKKSILFISFFLFLTFCMLSQSVEQGNDIDGEFTGYMTILISLFPVPI